MILHMQKPISRSKNCEIDSSEEELQLSYESPAPNLIEVEDVLSRSFDSLSIEDLNPTTKQGEKYHRPSPRKKVEEEGVDDEG